MKTYLMADPVRYPAMTTAQIRETFLIDSLYVPGPITQVYVDLDRAIVGMAAPTTVPMALAPDEALRANYFMELRELGALNIGGKGTIHVDGKSYTLDSLDCLYIGRGAKEVVFESTDPASPAIFYFLSYLAHAPYPTTLVRKDQASPTE